MKLSPCPWSKTGISPWLIRWAFSTMLLSRAWRKMASSRTVATAPESMMSRSTFPGPTEGSWSTSPTSTRWDSGLTALNSTLVSRMSIMEVSSTITRSAGIGSCWL